VRLYRKTLIGRVRALEKLIDDGVDVSIDVSGMVYGIGAKVTHCELAQELVAHIKSHDASKESKER